MKGVKTRGHHWVFGLAGGVSTRPCTRALTAASRGSGMRSASPESLGGTLLRPGGFDSPIPGRGAGHEGIDQPPGDLKDVLHGAIERLLVRLRRRVEAAHLSDELKRRGTDL